MTESCLPALNIAIKAAADSLQDQLQAAPALIRPYSAYLTQSSGKGIRARLLLSCSLTSVGEIPPAAIQLACAVELLHLATLVHDDVMDEADYRRDIFTLQKKFGRRRAVICGDYLFARSLQICAKALAETDEGIRQLDPAYLSPYATRIALGELRQTENNGNYKLGTLDYLRIISGKTAALFEAACYGGALLAQPADESAQLAQFRRFGRYLGMIFQLTDDCLDYESSRRQIGKNVRSDYDQAVVTLPLIYAMQEDPQLRPLAEKSGASRDSEQVYRRVLQSAALARTSALAARYRRKAEAELAQLKLPEAQNTALSELLALACREDTAALQAKSTSPQQK